MKKYVSKGTFVLGRTRVCTRVELCCTEVCPLASSFRTLQRLVDESCLCLDEVQRKINALLHYESIQEAP